MRLLLTASVVQVPLSHQGKLVVDHNLWLITSKCRGACNQAWPDALLGGSPAPGRGGPVESLPTAWQPGARPGPWAGAGSPPFSLSSTGTGVDLHTYPIPLYPMYYTYAVRRRASNPPSRNRDPYNGTRSNVRSKQTNFRSFFRSRILANGGGEGLPGTLERSSKLLQYRFLINPDHP